MTDHEIRIAIGKLCEWKDFRKPGGYLAELDNGEMVWLYDFPNDLNAMHEAVQQLRFPESMALWKINQRHLEDIVSRERQIAKDCVSFQWEVQNATARQRAEALLRTLNLWRE